MKKIVFATKNKGKIKEIQAVLGDSFEVRSMEDEGITIDVEENGETFEDNAVIKAEAIAGLCDCLVLADDSGLEIDYLNKQPGVHSARFMGKDTSYSIKNTKILEMLEGVEDEKRTARFVCAIACAGKGRKTFVIRETIEGIIGHKIEGDNGFGYDPIFFVPSLNKTTAQLSMEEKNKISHRGKALARIKEILLNEN